VIENLRVVLVSPRNPLNVGAAARAMSNFGCFDMRLVNAYRVAVDEARSAGAVVQPLDRVPQDVTGEREMTFGGLRSELGSTSTSIAEAPSRAVRNRWAPK